MADDNVERDDPSKSVVQGPDHGLSGREYTYQTPYESGKDDRYERDQPC